MSASLGIAAALGSFNEDKNTVAVSLGQNSVATSHCDGKQHVNWGGFKTNTDGSPLYLGGPVVWPGAMAPVGKDTDSWSVTGSSNNDIDNNGKLTSIAYCAGGKEPKVVRQKQIVLPSAVNGEIRKVSVSCPNNTVVIGGGWSAQTDDPALQPELAIMGLQRTSDRTWQVSTINYTHEQAGVTAIALCGQGKAPSEKVTTVDVHEGDDAIATAQCPKGKEVVFGGFQGMDQEQTGINAFIFGFYLAGDDAVKVFGAQNTVSPTYHDVAYMKAIAYCS